MSVKRKDSKGRVLRTGESQMPNGTYCYRYTQNGKRYAVYAPTLNELREKEVEVVVDKRNCVDYQKGNITIKELLERYMHIRRSDATSTKLNRKIKYRWICQQTISNVQVKHCVTSQIKEVCVQLHNEGKSFDYIKSYLSFFNGAFDQAVEDKIIARNPCSFKLAQVIPKTEPKDRILPSNEAIHDWMEMAVRQARSHQPYNMLTLILETGLRISEACALTLDDIDWQHRCIYVRRQITVRGGQHRLVRLKTTAAYRTIPLTQVAIDVLMDEVQHRKPQIPEYKIDGVSGFVFLTRYGHAQTAHNIQESCRTAVRLYNEKYCDGQPINVTPHLLRHAFCTNLINAHVDIKIVQYVMGHSSAGVTLDIYTHCSLERMTQIWSGASSVLTINRDGKSYAKSYANCEVTNVELCRLM